MSSVTPSILVIIPTYNEVDNLIPLTRLVLETLPDADVLIIDDNSADQTGALADDLARSEPRVQVFHRPRKLGYASGIKLGMEHALRNGYSHMLKMSADFMHNPRYLPRLVAQANDYDMIIGSRYVEGGSSVGDNLLLRSLTTQFNKLVAKMLRLDVRDCTSRFRCISTALLSAIHFNEITSDGLAFDLDILLRSMQHGCRLCEVAVIYDNRRVNAHAGGSNNPFKAMASVIVRWPQARPKQTEKR